MKAGRARMLSAVTAVLLVLAFLVPAATFAQPPGVLVSPPQANPQVHSGAPNLLEVDGSALGANISSLEWQTVFTPPAGPLTPRGITAGILNAIPPTIDAKPVDDQTVLLLPLDLPAGTNAAFVVQGTLTDVNAAYGEWKIDAGGVRVSLYQSAFSVMPVPAPVVGDTVRAVGVRTISPGPIVIKAMQLGAPGEPPAFETTFLFAGTVEATEVVGNSEVWTVGGVPFAFDPAVPPNVDPAIAGVGGNVTVEFMVLGAATPDPAAWAHLTLDPNTGLWKTVFSPAGTTAEQTGFILLRPTGAADQQTQVAYPATLLVVPAAAPAAPAGLTAALVGPSQVDLTWTDNSPDEASFRIERATDSLFTVGPVQDIAAFDDTTFSDMTVTLGDTFFYRIIAVNGAGDSLASNVAQVTVAPAGPAAPGNLAAEAVSPTTVSLTWADNSANGTGFRIERSPDGTVFTEIGAVGPSIVAFSDTNATPGGSFSYRVVALSAGAASAPSNVVAVTTPAAPPPPEGGVPSPTSGAPVQTQPGVSSPALGAPVQTQPGVTITVGVPGSAPSPAALSAPSVAIISPAAGAVIEGGAFEISVDVGNFTAVEPGANAAGDGHIVFYLDVGIPTTPGQPAVTAPGTYQATAETLVRLTGLEPGMHTLGVQLVNSDGTPLDPPVTAEVTITVAEATAPPSPAQSPVPTLTPETGEPTSDGSWGLIVGLIALAIVVIGSGIFLLGRGRSGGTAA